MTPSSMNESQVNQYGMYKIRVCQCQDESNYVEKTGERVFVPKEQHFVVYQLWCSYCHLIIAERDILIHEGYSELCDGCNYWAYGVEAPLDFAYVYHDTYLVEATH